MIRDIFIDNNIAKNFINPMDGEYKKLIKWLNRYDINNHHQCAHLVITTKLMGEYLATASNSESPNNIASIVDRLTREGRLNKIKPGQIKTFKLKYYTKRIVNSLSCNAKDRDHIPAVLLSDRKMAITLDRNLLYDLFNFPGFTVIAGRRPQDIPYDS